MKFKNKETGEIVTAYQHKGLDGSISIPGGEMWVGNDDWVLRTSEGPTAYQDGPFHELFEAA